MTKHDATAIIYIVVIPVILFVIAKIYDWLLKHL